MKTLHLVVPALVVSASLAVAQMSETVTTTTATPITAAGTVSTFDPAAQTVVVSGPGAASATYTYTPSTAIIDEAGNPVAVEVVRSGAPVTVYYTKEGDRLVASRVIVRRAGTVEEHTTTTTTTTP